MVRDSARMTHATYDDDEFNPRNEGMYALPNGADQRFIEEVNALSGYHAHFSSSDGDVMVRDVERSEFTASRELVNLANRFNMTWTDTYSTSQLVTFENDA